MSFGPSPWPQRSWDARAAANFMAGGLGSGLVVALALGGATGGPFALGAALVAGGLLAVWAEIGRPLRALNVFRHPGRSWMTREALAAVVLLPAALAAAAGAGGGALRALAAAAALAFVVCQGRILTAAKGIPAWREPLTAPLVVFTGLAEGAALALLLTRVDAATLAWLGVTLVARHALWRAWRRRLRVDPRAAARIDGAGRAFNGSTLLALAGCVAWSIAPAAPALAPLTGAAALLALAGGQWFKAVLVLRAGFNQGFALPHLPVRGARRG